MNLQQPVIAYVEDDEPSIYVMKMVVERLMKLKTFYVLQSNANFLQQVQKLGILPDLFLMDIQMKPHDGFELLTMLRSEARFDQCKVVAVTASVMNEEVMRLKKSGFDGAIAKPLKIDVFPELIEKIMRGESVWYIV